MNRNLWLLTALQGLFLTNNVTFIAINGLVGLSMAPYAWMATLPVMGYVVGGALATSLVAQSQMRWGRKVSFQLGLLVSLLACGIAAWAVVAHSFWLLVAATVVAGYYSANGQLYRFAAAELSSAAAREKAVSLVLAGGLLGAIAGPNLAAHSRQWLATPFLAAYLALAALSVLGLLVLWGIQFPAHVAPSAQQSHGRSLWVIARQPAFVVACLGAALGYGVMNLLMAATPLAMQQCGLGFDDAALVLEWHVIGMFAPGFVTGHLIKRWGTLPIMAVGVLLNLLCIAVALAGVELHHFVIALTLLGVGWNFLFTGSTTLALGSYRPEEKDRAQAAINFAVFAVMSLSSLASGALVVTQGWSLLNWSSLPLMLLMAAALWWLGSYSSPAHSARQST